MKIHFLGTGASEGIPALFCQCGICREARRAGGREIRTRCQALIDGELLIDFGPDTYMHLLRYSIDISTLRYCLITHTHSDHLYADDLEARAKGFANLEPGTPPLTVIGSRSVGEAVVRFDCDRVNEDGSVVFREAEPFVPLSLGEYSVIPLPAVHSTSEPLVYIISRGGKSLLYAHDTDILPDETLEKIAGLGIVFDLVSMDCTEGIKHIDYHGHMNIERCLEFRQMLLERGLADGNTVFAANHFSHNGRLSYTAATDPEINRGLVIAYDGLEIEF